MQRTIGGNQPPTTINQSPIKINQPPTTTLLIKPLCITMDELQMAMLRDKVWALKTAMLASGFFTIISVALLLQAGHDALLVLFLTAFVMYGVLFFLLYTILIKNRMKLHAQLYAEILEKIKQIKK